jgi:hypothetical protein
MAAEGKVFYIVASDHCGWAVVPTRMALNFPTPAPMISLAWLQQWLTYLI